MKKMWDRKKSVSEIVRYGIAGITTTLLNICLYHVLVILDLDYRVANLIAIISSKVYGYLVNKLFVFKSRCSTRKELYAEIFKFVVARGITGIIDYVGLFVLVEFFNFDKVITKYGITVVIIVLNFIFGKFLVFKNITGNKDMAKEIRVEYNSGNIEKYESKNPLKRLMVERLNQKILDSIGKIIGNKRVQILDAGCGEGYIDKLLVESFPNAEIKGLELAIEAITIARKTNCTVEYIQGDICEMPFEDNSFDLVICTEVLEHLPNPDRALKELKRVSNGNLLITVPHEPWFCMGNLLVLKNITRLGNPLDHINHWTMKSFSRFLHNAKTGEWKINRSFPWIIAKYERKENE